MDEQRRIEWHSRHRSRRQVLLRRYGFAATTIAIAIIAGYLIARMG